MSNVTVEHTRREDDLTHVRGPKGCAIAIHNGNGDLPYSAYFVPAVGADSGLGEFKTLTAAIDAAKQRVAAH